MASSHSASFPCLYLNFPLLSSLPTLSSLLSPSSPLSTQTLLDHVALWIWQLDLET